jgi:hypothetical protein
VVIPRTGAAHESEPRTVGHVLLSTAYIVAGQSLADLPATRKVEGRVKLLHAAESRLP